MENIFIALNRLLEHNQKAVLARIIRQVGSAPRSVGTKCLVLENGTIIGTIGGGLLEHQVQQKAMEIMKQGCSTILQYRLKGDEVARSEMLCGGEVDVFLEPVFPDNAIAKEIFQKAAAVCREGHKGVLLTRIESGIDYHDKRLWVLLEKGGEIIGPADEWIGAEPKQYESIKKPTLIRKTTGEPFIFAEPVEPDAVLYVFGAGHISTFVAPLAKMVGFRVVVIDDRREFANKERFSSADEILVMPFSEVFNHIDVHSTSYIAIITRGHTHDRDVLRLALQKEPTYIGMIGSKRKRDLIYQSLLDEGIAKEKIKQVYSPIGLDIGSETPEEIAISIIAQLIQHRSKVDNFSRPR
jgi:xanthine dehydrogenase accessory factor